MKRSCVGVNRMDNWRETYETMEVFVYKGASDEVVEPVRFFPNAELTGLTNEEEDPLITPKLFALLDLLGGGGCVVPGWRRFLFSREEFEVLIED